MTLEQIEILEQLNRSISKIPILRFWTLGEDDKYYEPKYAPQGLPKAEWELIKKKGYIDIVFTDDLLISHKIE
jgi:hypothetical protein